MTAEESGVVSANTDTVAKSNQTAAESPRPRSVLSEARPGIVDYPPTPIDPPPNSAGGEDMGGVRSQLSPSAVTIMADDGFLAMAEALLPPLMPPPLTSGLGSELPSGPDINEPSEPVAHGVLSEGVISRLVEPPQSVGSSYVEAPGSPYVEAPSLLAAQTATVHTPERSIEAPYAQSAPMPTVQVSLVETPHHTEPPRAQRHEEPQPAAIYAPVSDVAADHKVASTHIDTRPVEHADITPPLIPAPSEFRQRAPEATPPVTVTEAEAEAGNGSQQLFGNSWPASTDRQFLDDIDTRIPVAAPRPFEDVSVYDDDDPETVEAIAIGVILEWIAVIVGALVVALVIKTFLFQAFHIPSASMVPTLKVGDRVLVNKLSYELHDVNRGDLVVFGRPDEGVSNEVDDLIKRVIGLPGETVEARAGTIYIDGQELIEPYLRDVVVTNDFGPVDVGDEQMFVMGDNRGDSRDSRVFGPQPTEKLVGRAFLRVWPPGNIGFL